MYLIFLDNLEFDQDNLAKHLSYLRRGGGRPAMMISADTQQSAIDKVVSDIRSGNIKIATVTDENYRVVNRFVASGELFSACMTCGNETKYTKVIHKGILKEWVGIGWIPLRIATKDDVPRWPESIQS